MAREAGGRRPQSRCERGPDGNRDPGLRAYPAGGAVSIASPLGGLSTEYPFTLPRGYVDSSGTLHREGVMRLATARDEIAPQSDARVRANPAYLTVLLLERTVVSLGTVHEVSGYVIEGLFASDLAFLQDLYRRINQDGRTTTEVACPSCSHDFTIDVAGDAPGES
ncbi:hypothetical protein ACFCXT_25420 [Streptomyces vinaceus]|uniref:hypothetical protein n=1 Tax=Streptomyces vinaceus TaxID=1960 RepID=UPI0035D7BD9E